MLHLLQHYLKSCMFKAVFHISPFFTVNEAIFYDKLSHNLIMNLHSHFQLNRMYIKQQNDVISSTGHFSTVWRTVHKMFILVSYLIILIYHD